MLLLFIAVLITWIWVVRNRNRNATHVVFLVDGVKVETLELKVGDKRRIEAELLTDSGKQDVTYEGAAFSFPNGQTVDGLAILSSDGKFKVTVDPDEPLVGHLEVLAASDEAGPDAPVPGVLIPTVLKFGADSDKRSDKEQLVSNTIEMTATEENATSVKFDITEE